jgi:catechol 2,3-dioxygenase-like lactoylglutathione lyase family enzyme
MQSHGLVKRHHHVTICVGGAQEDHDFHTKLLGLRSVKKTLFYDGSVPIYHLYYGNDAGEESTLLTTFPVAHIDRKARRGTGQFSSMDLSIAEASYGFWKQRLKEHGVAFTEHERFGEQRLRFKHPGGHDYELATVKRDDRVPATSSVVPREHAIRGSHGITLPLRDLEHHDEFMTIGWGARKAAQDGSYVRYVLGEGESGQIIDHELQPDVKAGDWMLGQGMIHHCAFEVKDFESQDRLKAFLEGLGFTDTSDRKDRGYFYSVYVRSPSGALFEATVTKEQGFLRDEPKSELGKSVMLSPQFEARRKEILAQMEPIVD